MKAQTEMLGLIVIVILFIIIGVLLLTLSQKQPETGLIEHVKQNNLVNAILLLTPCDDTPMRDIIKECYLEERSYCNMNCKAYVKSEIQNIMNQKPIRYSKYEFNLLENGNALSDWKITSGAACGETTKLISRKINTRLGVITTEFMFC